MLMLGNDLHTTLTRGPLLGLYLVFHFWGYVQQFSSDWVSRIVLEMSFWIEE